MAASTKRSREAKRRPRLTPRAEFLNVDLDVRSRRSLAALRDAWPWAQTPGFAAGRVPRRVLVSPRGMPKSAEGAIRELIRLVEALPRGARRCWNEASSRVFDIGVQAGLQPRSFEEARVSEKTLRSLTRLKGSIQFTLYPPHEE